MSIQCQTRLADNPLTSFCYSIGEFGISQPGDGTATVNVARLDLERSQYFEDYVVEIYKAMTEDNIKIIGAMAWSFLDQWEFGNPGYGLQWMDPATMKRYYKQSLFKWVNLFQRKR